MATFDDVPGLALSSRTFTFELSLAGSPRVNVEHDYVGKPSIPTAGLSPASPTALWAAVPDLTPSTIDESDPGRDRQRILSSRSGACPFRPFPPGALSFPPAACLSFRHRWIIQGVCFARERLRSRQSWLGSLIGWVPVPRAGKLGRRNCGRVNCSAASLPPAVRS
jgi:hypothetical protein